MARVPHLSFHVNIGCFPNAYCTCCLSYASNVNDEMASLGRCHQCSFRIDGSFTSMTRERGARR